MLPFNGWFREEGRSALLLATILLLASACVLECGCAVLRPQSYQSFATKTPVPANSYLVIGFMAGVQAWDAENHTVRTEALRLRSLGLPNVNVETVQNQQWNLALQLIHNALDRNQDGKLDDQERASARLILYGHSLGGAAVVKVARKLQEQGVPVLLTIQIDSFGSNDRVIPSNVARAANFYQREGPIVRGLPEIVAEDPKRTTVLGNFKYDYTDTRVDESEIPWIKRVAEGGHGKMEYDPDVWARVEALIVQEIQPGAGSQPTGGR